MARGRRAAAAILGVAALAAAAAAIAVGRGGGAGRALAEPARDDVRGALEAARVAALRELEAEATEAAKIPQLRHALEQKMDAFTLEDLFASEDWWAPHRARVVVITSAGGIVAKRNAPAAGLPIETLDAAEGKPATVRAGATAVLVATAPVPGAPGFALVLGQAVDAHLLADWADRSRAALVVSDGHVALPGAAPGPAPPEALVGHEEERLVVDGSGGWFATPVSLGAGVWIWGARLLPPPTGAGLALPLGGLAGLALLASLGLLVTGRRAAATSLESALPAPPIAAPTTGPVAVVRQTSAAMSTVIAPGEPQVFGRYTVIDRVGEGGMCDIYSAALTGPEGFQRVFVLKRLKPAISRNRAAVDQFIDEAKLGSILVHSNIVPVFDFGKVGDGYFIAQEYVVGRNVGQLLERHLERLAQPLDVAIVAFIAHETLQALGYAHDKTDDNGLPLNIVHRDVSPGNILVSRNGEPKLIDFGIVKAEGRVSQTDTGNVKGNAAYMAPEQARGLAVDRRADLFSLSLVMFRALSREPFYNGGTTAEVFYLAASGPTEEQLARLDTMPESNKPIVPILRRALAANPADRYDTAEDFAAALAPLIAPGTKIALGQLMHALFGGELRSPGSAGSGGTNAATSAQRANGQGSR